MNQLKIGDVVKVTCHTRTEMRLSRDPHMTLSQIVQQVDQAVKRPRVNYGDLVVIKDCISINPPTYLCITAQGYEVVINWWNMYKVADAEDPNV